MKKYKLSEIKRLVSYGHAINLTNANKNDIPLHYEKIGYSTGVYGISGGLIQDNEGQLYAITARSTNLFRIF